MSEKELSRPAFLSQFEEIARLEAALRAGELSGQAASDALNRVYQLMGFRNESEACAEVAEYLVA